MLARCVEDPFERAQLRDIGAVQPILIQEIELSLHVDEKWWEEKGHWDVIYPIKEIDKSSLAQSSCQVVFLRIVMNQMHTPEKSVCVPKTMTPIVRKLDANEY
jgi:hypothetical protein